MPKILLIDDDEIGRDALARRLMRKGWQVTASTEGDEGLSQAQSATPDVAVVAMSLVMPDGWEVTRQIKSDAAIPVIGIVEENTPDEHSKAVDAGCDEVAARPIHIEQMVEKIQRLLDRQTIR